MKNILLIVDLQKGFLVAGANDMVKPRVDALLNAEVFDSVISTIYYNYEGSPIIRLMGWNKLKTAEEQEVVGLAATRSHHFLRKSTYSAYSNDLVELLRAENGGALPEWVFVVGVDTDCCVLATAADLFEAGIRPVVLTRYCGASGGEQAHLAGIRCLQSLIGPNNLYDEWIATKEDVAKALERARIPACAPSASSDKAARVVDLLAAAGRHIAFAESCTGGKVSARLVDGANASAVLGASFVTYSNEAKIQNLGVSPATLEAHGAVSEAVALEMAEGAAKSAGAQIGVGISGIAGPTGGTPEKPVGTVCFGFYGMGEPFAVTKHFGDRGRNAVRDASTEFVYDTLLRCLSR